MVAMQMAGVAKIKSRTKDHYITTMDIDETTIPAAEPLSSQVGGHAGVLATEDGSLIIKPSLHAELTFYQTLQQNPRLASLRPYTPKFMGTLRLEGQVDRTKPAEPGAINIAPLDVPEKDESQFRPMKR